MAIATCIRTNQNPNSVRRCEAPPHTIWGLEWRQLTEVLYEGRGA